jgi:hypothetical protein
VSAEVYDARGAHVATLVDARPVAAGLVDLTWDASALGVRSLASGIYILRVRAGTWRAEKRFVVTR